MSSNNILKEANDIVNKRSDEKERQYGPFDEGMKRAAQIASGMSGRKWSSDDIYIAMIALKFSRQSYNQKRDNLLDAVAYIGGWQNAIEKREEWSEDLKGPDVVLKKRSASRLCPPSASYTRENTTIKQEG
jgi:hypothetical protein